MSLHTTLGRFHGTMRRTTILVVFTATTRLLLATAFLPSGLTKVRGERFTSLGLENPVGFFFEAFYRTGGWYQVVGAAQVLAALLLLVPRLAHLGAFLFLPIIFNIWVITVAVGFRGTWVITSLMLLANLWLVAWEYDRIAPLLAARPASLRQTPAYRGLMVLGAGGCAACWGVLWWARIARLERFPFLTGLGIALALGSCAGVAVAWYSRRT
jgi:uncharacterized membrane protein YphA (DoxX/SURF4 family)